MNRFRRCLLASSGLLLLYPTSVCARQQSSTDLINADRPGIADGTAVARRGQLQIETGIQREFRRDGSVKTKTSFIPTLVRLGLGGRWEARIETNAFSWLEVSEPMTTERSSGWTPASLGFKRRLLKDGDDDAASLGLIGRVFPRSGSRTFSTTRTTGDVRLAADLKLSDALSLNPNVGVGRYEDVGEGFTAALLAVTLSYSRNDRFNPFIDVGFQRPVGIGAGAALIIDTGVGYVLRRNVQLDVSVGSGAHGPAPHPFISFGVSVRSH